MIVVVVVGLVFTAISRYAAGLIEFLLLTHKEEKTPVLPSSPGVFACAGGAAVFRWPCPLPAMLEPAPSHRGARFL